MNIPNLLTLVRITLMPAFVLLFYAPIPYNRAFAAAIFIFAAFTDLFDGYLARNLAQTTKFGEFLDPVADKIMVAVALMLIVSEFSNFYITIPAIVIICREIIISALREWMAEIGKRTSVAVGLVAKIKTTLQMIALIFLLLYQPGSQGVALKIVGVFCLDVAAILTLWSMVMYLRAAWPDIYPTASKKPH